MLGPGSNARTTTRFADNVSAGGNKKLEKTVDTEATAEEIYIRFYPGPENDLEIEIERERENDTLPLIDLKGRSVITGDNDEYSFDIAESLQEGDNVKVTANNTDQNNSYDFVVDVTIDRAGGTGRVITSLLDSFREAL
jgi:hypothetical protein